MDDVFYRLQELQKELRKTEKQLEKRGYPSLWRALAEPKHWTLPNEITTKMRYRLSIKRYFHFNQAADWFQFYWEIVVVREIVEDFISNGNSSLKVSRQQYDDLLLRTWAIQAKSKLMKLQLKDYCETLSRMAKIVLKYTEIEE